MRSKKGVGHIFKATVPAPGRERGLCGCACVRVVAAPGVGGVGGGVKQHRKTIQHLMSLLGAQDHSPLGGAGGGRALLLSSLAVTEAKDFSVLCSRSTIEKQTQRREKDPPCTPAAASTSSTVLSLIILPLSLSDPSFNKGVPLSFTRPCP